MSGSPDGDIQTVNRWMRHGGEMPDDAQICVAVHCAITAWRKDRASGMDVLASSELDNLAGIVMALRERT